MIGKFLADTGDFLCKYRDNKVVKIFNRMIEIFYFKINNDNYTLKSNGEGRIIRLLSDLGFRSFFDVGANHGDWSKVVMQVNKSCLVYSFEISPITFKILSTELKEFSEIKLFNNGFYNKKGIMKFHQDVNDDAQSSLINQSKKYNTKIIEVAVTTIDDFLQENKIDEIDFLKIDTEGADFEILKGAEISLRNGKIKAIQFEYGFVSVDTKNLLKDYYELLHGYGYAIGKIYPLSVEFSDYNRKMENFIGPNFIAIREDLTEVKMALSKK